MIFASTGLDNHNDNGNVIMFLKNHNKIRNNQFLSSCNFVKTVDSLSQSHDHIFNFHLIFFNINRPSVAEMMMT